VARRRRHAPASAASVAAPPAAGGGGGSGGWRSPLGPDAATGDSPGALRRCDGSGRSPTHQPSLDDLVGAASTTPPKQRGVGGVGGGDGRTSPANGVGSGGSPRQQRRSRRPSRDVTGLDAVPEAEQAVPPIDAAVSPSTFVGSKAASPLGYASALPAIPKTQPTPLRG